MFRLVPIMLILLAAIIVPANAQSDNVLNYGDTVTGEITNEGFEVEYTFSGSKGDVIVITMKDADDYQGELDSPSINLLDTDYGVIGAVDSYKEVQLFAELPIDGDYYILATRENGRSGESIGEFTLTLEQAIPLTIAEAITNTISDTETHYYTYKTREPFVIAYAHENGDYMPNIQVNIIEDYEIEEVALLSGSILQSGSLGLYPDTSGAQPYLILVTSPLWYWREGNTADYQLVLSLPGDTTQSTSAAVVTPEANDTEEPATSETEATPEPTETPEIDITPEPSLESGSADTFSVIANGSVNLRSCAGTECNIVGTTTDGQMLTVISSEGDWYEIQYNDGSAFIANWLTTRGPDEVISIDEPYIDLRTGCIVAFDMKRGDMDINLILTGEKKNDILADLYRPNENQPLSVAGQLDKTFIDTGDTYILQYYSWNIGWPEGMYQIEITLDGETSKLAWELEQKGEYNVYVLCE